MMKKPLEGIDRTFLKCLEEIMHTYTCLDKQGRVRVEQWVQKLAAVPLSAPISAKGSSTHYNIVWKKHRNAYAKLLLNMVASRHLSPPFSNLPPAGSLKPFPNHLGQVNDIAYSNKNLLGPHETSFWRELFDSIESDSNASQINSQSFLSFRENSVSSSHIYDQSKKDISSLQLLVKEQEIRIKLLENQLREERTQFELSLERLQMRHREEIQTITHLFISSRGNDSHSSSDALLSSHDFALEPSKIPSKSKSSFFSFSDDATAAANVAAAASRSHGQDQETRFQAGARAGAGEEGRSCPDPSMKGSSVASSESVRRYRYTSVINSLERNELEGRKDHPAGEDWPVSGPFSSTSSSSSSLSSSAHRQAGQGDGLVAEREVRDLFPQPRSSSGYGQGFGSGSGWEKSSNKGSRTDDSVDSEDSLSTAPSHPPPRGGFTWQGREAPAAAVAKREEVLGPTDEDDDFLRYIEGFQRDIQAMKTMKIP